MLTNYIQTRFVMKNFFLRNLNLAILLFLITVIQIYAQDPVTYERAFPNLRFEFPTEIQNANDGSNRLFVVEQPGKIKVFDNNSNTRSSQTFLNIENIVSFSSGQEIGLLGLAFHPNYKNNGYFYVYHTRSSRVSGVRVEIVVARYKVSSNNPNRADSSSRLEIFSFDKNQGESNHNGGKIAFGPDGYLYASIGDGGGAGDPRRNSQNLNNVFGSILRIDVDLDGNNPVENNPDRPNGNYEIPSDNPRVGRSGLDELYAWGIRNTWKFSFDTETNRLWGADVGQRQLEEINLIRKGGNYGWNRFEGNQTFRSATSLVTSPDIKPVFNYNRNNGDKSITGGYVYRGSSRNSAIQGKYIFGDFVTGRVWALTYNSQNGNASRRLLFRTNGISVSSFGLDESNELYFSGYGNSSQLYKIVGGNDQNPGIVTINGVGKFEKFQNGTNGILDAVASSGNTTYLAGRFTRASGTSVRNIAAFTEGEGWSSLANGANGRVSTLAIDRNGNLYAGGAFTRIGGVSANYIARWNGTRWSAVGRGTDGPVAKIIFDSNNVMYVGGAFENAGNVRVNNIAKYDNSWSALRDSRTGAVGTNNEIRAIDLDQNNTLYIGGNFDTAGGRTANRIATYNGSRWGTLGRGTSGFVQAIDINANYIYAGGNFTAAGGNTVNRIARWNRSANRWEKIENGVSGNVNAIQLQDGFVYIAGNFETATTGDEKIYRVNNLARWNNRTGWQALGTRKSTGTDNEINALISNGEKSIVIAGNFSDAGRVDASNIAIWNNNNDVDTDVIVDGAIYEMQPQHNTSLRLQVRANLSPDGDKVADGAPRNAIPAQRFKFISQGNNIYKIEPQSDIGLRLDVDGGKTATNTEIHIFRDNGGRNQLWEAIPIGNTGLFRFAPQNARANRLDIENVGGTPRALSRRLDNGSSQRWKLIPVSSQPDRPSIDTSIVYEIEPQNNTRLRLDVRGNKSANSTLVIGYARHGRANQQWRFISVGDDIYEIEPQNAKGKRLGIAGEFNTSENAAIDIYDDLDQKNQRWKAIPIENTGLFRFEPRSANGKRLDIENVGNGAKVLSRNLNNRNSQKWRLVPSTNNKLIDPFEEDSFSIYPNPFSTSANLALNIAQFNKGLLKITNINGKVLQEISFDKEDQNVSIQRKGMASGIYLCSLVIDGETIQTRKLIVE